MKYETKIVEAGFEYFLNVTIPMSERFYASKYAEKKTGVIDREEAITKICILEYDTFSESGHSEASSLFNRIMYSIRSLFAKRI